MGFMHNFGVWPHPNLAVHSLNPMGYFAPHPEAFNVGAADAMNKYLGVPLFKGPTGQGLPWVPEPKAASTPAAGLPSGPRTTPSAPTVSPGAPASNETVFHE